MVFMLSRWLLTELSHHGHIAAMKDELNDYVTVKQASEITGLHHRYVRRLCAANKLACVRMGKMFLISRKAATAFRRDPYGRGRPKGEA